MPVPTLTTDSRMLVVVSATFWGRIRLRMRRLRFQTSPELRNVTLRMPTGPFLPAPSEPVTRRPPVANVW